MTKWMSITSLLPIAGAAAGVVAACASNAVEGASSAFANLIAKSEPKPIAHPLNEPLKLPSQSDAEAALAQAKQRLYARLAELGITLQQPIKLAVDAFGKIRETSGHPHAPEIEQVFANDETLANTFRHAASQMEILRAGKEHQQFAELYAKNPDLAIAQYSHLFDDDSDPPRFVLQLSGETLEPLFEPA